MKPFYYLSDLHVDSPEHRKGHARALMQYLIKNFGGRSIQRLTLDTATTNTGAQKLYESLGYSKESNFVTYHKIL